MINHVFTRKASDGAGKFRGGLALVRQHRFLAEEGISQLLTGRGVVVSSRTSSAEREPGRQNVSVDPAIGELLAYVLATYRIRWRDGPIAPNLTPLAEGTDEGRECSEASENLVDGKLDDFADFWEHGR